MPTYVQPWILQICHGYEAPFMDCARQYAGMFKGGPFKVLTVYLTGKPSDKVVQGTDSDEVIFLDFSSRDIGGLKLAAIARIRALSRSRRCVLCIAHRFKSIHVALLGTALPVVGVNHAFDVYQRVTRQWFVRLFQSRLLLLGVSDAVRDNIRDCLKGWPADHIQTLYNRVDPDALITGQVSRAEARLFLGLAADAWIIASVGRLHPKKDQSTLIRAFAEALPRLPEHAQLVLVGKGEMEKSLKSLAESLGLGGRVQFLGFVPEVWRYFKAFDDFLLVTDREPFGMVLLEAMVAGVPVHCTDCGGSCEVVSGLGQLFRYGDVQSIAAGLVSRVEAGQDLIALQQRMLLRVRESFSDEAVRQRFLSMPLIENWLASSS